MNRRKKLTVEDYEEGIRSQNRALLGRAMTLIESTKLEHRLMANDLLQKILPLTSQAIRIGISGVPGVGKSTFIDSFGMHLIKEGYKVAVLAIDPSSQVSQGSILGDKTRMYRLCVEENAFIRPSPSACSLGGVARRTRENMLLCEAAGYNVILIETVGVGQSEIAVSQMTDFFLVLMLAGAGDELQGIKKGILEIADLIAITKADGDNLLAAKRAQGEYNHALHYLKSLSSWKSQTVLCSALQDQGMGELWQLILEHRALLQSTGEFSQKRERQHVEWLWQELKEQIFEKLLKKESSLNIDVFKEEVKRGNVVPSLAASQLLEGLLREF